MLQLRSAIQAFPASRKRILALTHEAGHLVRIINDMVAQITGIPKGGEAELVDDLVNSKFLFAGYDSAFRQFVIYRIYYDRGQQRYVYENRYRIGARRERPFLFIGDQLGQHQGSISGYATYQLRSLLQARNKIPHGTLDWEPLEVLREHNTGAEVFDGWWSDPDGEGISPP